MLDFHDVFSFAQFLFIPSHFLRDFLLGFLIPITRIADRRKCSRQCRRVPERRKFSQWRRRDMLLYFSVTLKNCFQNYCSFIHFDDATFQNSASYNAFCSLLLLILKYSDQTIDSDAYFSFVELNWRITCDRRQSRIMRHWRDIVSYAGSTRVLNLTKTFCNLLGFHYLSFVLICLDFISDSRQPCQSLPVLFQSLMRFKFCAWAASVYLNISKLLLFSHWITSSF